MQKAKLWRAAGREDKVLEEIAALSEAMPQESQYNIMLADSYMKNKDYAKALAYYNRALEHNPNDPYAWRNTTRAKVRPAKPTKS